MHGSNRLIQPQDTRKGRHPLTSLKVRHGLDIKPVEVTTTDLAFSRDMYKLQMKQELNRSSHSTISSVEHSRYGSIVAKVVHPAHGTSGLAASESQQRKWIREMQAMKGLDHVSEFQPSATLSSFLAERLASIGAAIHHEAYRLRLSPFRAVYATQGLSLLNRGRVGPLSYPGDQPTIPFHRRQSRRAKDSQKACLRSQVSRPATDHT